MDNSVRKIYGDRVRVRVCGICFKEDNLLLVNHKGLAEGDFWAPPGGELEFGQDAPENLAREFREETGLEIRVGDFLFACEFVQSPLHAVELFFEVAITGGSLFRGSDPEMKGDEQLIQEVKFMSGRDVGKIPPANKHGLFGLAAGDLEKIRQLKGYFKI